MAPEALGEGVAGGGGAAAAGGSAWASVAPIEIIETDKSRLLVTIFIIIDMISKSISHPGKVGKLIFALRRSCAVTPYRRH